MSKVLYYGSATQIHSGASQWMYRLADKMREHGYDTMAILPEDDGIADWYHDSGILIEFRWCEPLRIRSPIKQLLYLIQAFVHIFSFATYVRQNEIEIVHINEIRYLPGLVGAALGGATVVCHVRAYIESYLIRWVIARITATFADDVICVSEATRDHIFGEVGVNGEHIHVIHDAVPSPERFEEINEGDDFRKKFDIESDSVLVTQVSKLNHNKAQDRIVSAADYLSDEIEIAIVGGEVEGSEEYVNDLRREASMYDNVTIVGFYEDITDVYDATDIIIHAPRHGDPFPGVVLEGMIAGKPVIGTKAGGIEEQITDEQTGITVEKDVTSEELARTIEELVNNKEKREALGAAANSIVRQKLDPGVYFKQISEIYRDTPKEAQA